MCMSSGPGKHARFELQCALGGVRLLSNIGFQLAQIRQIEAYLLGHLDHLCSEWERLHDDH